MNRQIARKKRSRTKSIKKTGRRHSKVSGRRSKVLKRRSKCNRLSGRKSCKRKSKGKKRCSWVKRKSSGRRKHKGYCKKMSGGANQDGADEEENGPPPQQWNVMKKTKHGGYKRNYFLRIIKEGGTDFLEYKSGNKDAKCQGRTGWELTTDGWCRRAISDLVCTLPMPRDGVNGEFVQIMDKDDRFDAYDNLQKARLFSQLKNKLEYYGDSKKNIQIAQGEYDKAYNNASVANANIKRDRLLFSFTVDGITLLDNLDKTYAHEPGKIKNIVESWQKGFLKNFKLATGEIRDLVDKILPKEWLDPGEKELLISALEYNPIKNEAKNGE